MLISEAVEEYLGVKQNAVTHDTHQWYTHHLRVFLGWCATNGITELTQISPLSVQRAASSHRSSNTNTRHGYVQVIKGFLRWCAEDDELGVKERVVKRIELPKAVQPDITIYTDQEITHLFRACEKMRHPHRNKAVLYMLLDTGIRISELCVDGTRPEEETGLRIDNLILSRDGSYIRVMGKGRKPRTIGLGNETRLAVQRYLNRERGHSASPYVFLAQGDEPLSVRMLQQFLRELSKVTHVDHVHAHRFRHTFCINQLISGTSDIVLMKLLGHSTLDSTKIYARSLSAMQAMKSAPSVVDQMKKRGGRRQ